MIEKNWSCLDKFNFHTRTNTQNTCYRNTFASKWQTPLISEYLWKTFYKNTFTKILLKAGSSAMIEKNWSCLDKFNSHPRTNPLSAETRKSTNPDMWEICTQKTLSGHWVCVQLLYSAAKKLPKCWWNRLIEKTKPQFFLESSSHCAMFWCLEKLSLTPKLGEKLSR